MSITLVVTRLAAPAWAEAAESLRRQGGQPGRWFARSGSPGTAIGGTDLEFRFLEFGDVISGEVRSGTAGAAQLDEVAGVLAEAPARVKEILDLDGAADD